MLPNGVIDVIAFILLRNFLSFSLEAAAEILNVYFVAAY